MDPLLCSAIEVKISSPGDKPRNLYDQLGKSPFVNNILREMRMAQFVLLYAILTDIG